MKNGNEEFKEWFKIIDSEEKLPARKKSGWAKIAFTYAFKYLKAGYDYEKSLCIFLYFYYKKTKC